MKREIKFRAWDKENKVLRYCDFLSFLPNGIRFCFTDYDRDETMVCNWTDYELMQFTGLKDKNGVDIYEGDIVHSDGGITCQVSWVDDNRTLTFGWYLTTPQGFLAGLTPSTGKIIEIIGNIYEHPNLLQP